MVEHLLNYLGADNPGSQQGHAGVLKVVEAGGVGETRLFEKRLGGGQWGRYRDDFRASGKWPSFCLLCKGGVAAFIYVRLIAR